MAEAISLQAQCRMTASWVAMIKTGLWVLISRATPGQASVEQALTCSSRRARTIIGTRLQSTITRFISWRSKRRWPRSSATKPISVTFWKNRFMPITEIVPLRRRTTADLWPTWTRGTKSPSRKSWRPSGRRGAPSKRSIKSVASSNSTSLINGRTIGNSCTTIKPTCFNEIGSRNLKTRIKRPKYSKLDCKQLEKMPKSLLKQKNKRESTEIKKRSSSHLWTRNLKQPPLASIQAISWLIWSRKHFRPSQQDQVTSTLQRRKLPSITIFWIMYSQQRGIKPMLDTKDRNWERSS